MHGKYFAAVLAMSLLFVAIGFVVIELSQNQEYNIVAWATTGIIVGLTITNLFGDFLPLPRQKMVISYSGIPGRKAGEVEPLPGGRGQMLTAFNRTVLPAEIRKEKFGKFYMFKGLSSGTIHLYLRGMMHQFKELDPKDCENPDGCMFFVGRIDGSNLRDPSLMASHAELDRLQGIISKMRTSAQKTSQQVYNLINRRITDVRQFSNELKIIGDNVNKTYVIGKGASGAAEAVAAQDTH